MKLIVDYGLFTRFIKIYVVDSEKVVNIVQAKTNEANDMAFSLAEQYSCSDIELMGPKMFVQGIQKKMEDAQIAKYSVKKYNIILTKKGR